MDENPQLITVWSQTNSRCLPQLINISKHKNGDNSVGFANIELKFDAVAENVFTSHAAGMRSQKNAGRT